MRASCRSENWCFFVCHAWSACVWGTQFKQVLCDGLWVDFDAVSSVFFQMDCSFRRTTCFSFSLLDGSTNFAKLRSKSPKICGKVCAHHFVQIAEGLKKIYCSSLGSRLQMCTYSLYKKNFARRYLALTASVQIRIGSPKTARNEQVSAHQKSYSK